VYKSALEKFDSNHISLIGDSAGGTLVLGLVQRLIIENLNVPNKIVVISPVMDASMSNPEIKNRDNLDPMLSRVGVLSAKKMCAGNLNLKDVMISPLFGNFNNF